MDVMVEATSMRQVPYYKGAISGFEKILGFVSEMLRKTLKKQRSSEK